MKRQKITITVLTILLLVSVSYIAFDKFQEAKNVRMQQAFQLGYNQGVNDAVVALYQQTNNCQPTLISIGNVTRRIVDTACLAR